MSVGPKRETSVHVRLDDETARELELWCEVNGVDRARACSQFIAEALMGRTHVLKVAAKRLVVAGLIGNERDRR